MRDLVRARATAAKVLVQGAPASPGISAAAWPDLFRTSSLDASLSTLADDGALRSSCATDRAAGLYPCRRSRLRPRVDRLTRQIEELLPSWSMAPVVEAIQAMRGVALIVRGHGRSRGRRFCPLRNPRQLMAYLGLVPSEHSSGASDAAGRHHQGRQRPGAAGPDRRGLDIPHAGAGQPKASRSPGSRCRGDPRHRLEGAGRGCAAGIDA